MENISGLAMICSYSDDEDNIDNCSTGIDICLFDSVNSESQCYNTDISSKPQCNHNSKLPLPPSLGKLFKDTPLINNVSEDDPNLHDGRIRSFPHLRGNWSTYVYVPYEPEEGFEELLARLETCTKRAGLALKTICEPHISLSRTVVLLHHWIDSFVSSIKIKFCHLPRFNIQLGAPAVYTNEERTRTFLGLQVLTSSSQLFKATLLVNESLEEFCLPPFYKDPSFHMSVLWVVGDHEKTLAELLPLLQAEFEAYRLEYPHEFNIDVIQCLCKTGNKTFAFPLALEQLPSK